MSNIPEFILLDDLVRLVINTFYEPEYSVIIEIFLRKHSA